MENPQLQRVGKWLDLTDQQFGILLSLYKLETIGEKTTPKNIEHEYLKTYGRAPQRSNLFGQIRQLLSRNMITKEGQGSYSVNFGVIYALLQDRKDAFIEELNEFNRVSEQIKEYFRKAAIQTTKPKVEYFNYDEFYNALAESIKTKERFYTTTKFPSIAYTYSLSAGIGTINYTNTVWERCFERRELQACYLTTLDVDFPFNHAFRVYGDPKRAYRECIIVIDQLWNQIQTHPNLDVRFLKELHGMDVFIPETHEPKEFFLFTRDEHRNIIGGIKVMSPETAISAKQMFMRDFEYAERLTGQKGEEIMENLKKELEERYSICKV
ncbi:MAG: hypothetical protein JW778_03755 [Candidatus Altiarchaeota archaeon]|nr:hypothetical protein [Candidatus Altiarchaeota archaeon]